MAKTKQKTNKSAAIREALKATPDKSAAEIAKEVGVSPALVYNVKANMKKKRRKPARNRSKSAAGRKSGSKMAAPVKPPMPLWIRRLSSSSRWADCSMRSS